MTTTISRPPTAPNENEPEVQSLVAAWYAGTIGRRDFLMRATATLGSLAAATTLLESCGGSSPTATPPPVATTAATRAAGSAAAPAASPSAASPSATATTAPTAAAASGSPVATAAPAGTTAASSASAATRPAGSSVASGTTTASGSAVASGSGVATGVPADAVNAKMIQYKNGTTDIIAYEARPKSGTGPFPAIIVIHENTGLTDHIKDVTRRVAKEGYVGLGIDFLSRDGGTMAFNTPQDATAAINKVADEQMISDVNAAITYLTGSGVSAPKVGLVGFCLGGRWTLVSAEKAKGLGAAVAYYGFPSGGTNATQTVNPIKEAASLTCPLMGNYGAADPGIPPAMVQQLQQALQASGKPLDFKVFDGTGHAFNNDTRPSNGNVGYNPTSALDAWTRTLGWFKKYVT